MHKKITQIMTLLGQVMTRDDPKLLNVGLIFHQLKADMEISEKARILAKDAIECIDVIVNECSDFKRELKRLTLITEEMNYSYEKGYWVNSVHRKGKCYELVDQQCDICNVNPFFAMQFLEELDKNVDQIRTSLFKIKLDMENKRLARQCYKSFHTLNGIASYLDLRTLQRLLYLAERYVLKDIKNHQLISAECLELLFKIFRCLKDYFKNWKERGDSVILIPDSFYNLFNQYQITQLDFALS